MDINPYESPREYQTPVSDLLDRDAREQLAALLELFLNEELTAFEFAEQLQPFGSSNDRVVAFVADTVWFHYDDCTDHLVALSKPEWDYFQRLLLLLTSEVSVTSVQRRRWHWTQWLAIAGLFAFVAVAIQVGWGNHLLLATVPFGMLSIGIASLRSEMNKREPYQALVYPFGSFAELKHVYEAARFRKRRYPPHLMHRAVRSPLGAAMAYLQFYLAWLILSPCVLGYQSLPLNSTDIRIVSEGTCAAG